MNGWSSFATKKIHTKTCTKYIQMYIIQREDRVIPVLYLDIQTPREESRFEVVVTAKLVLMSLNKVVLQFE